MQLTTEQQAVIRAPLRHTRVMAVAGSGKTTTLAHRVLFLLEQGLPAERLLVLMFNKRAQQDFTRRLQSLCESPRPLPQIRTYHAMGLRLHQRMAQRGWLRPSTGPVLSDNQRHWRLWQLIRQHSPRGQSARINEQKESLLELATALLDEHKASLIPLPELAENWGLSADRELLINALNDFECERREQGLLTYADMLFDPVNVLEQREEARAWVANHMEMILVDEYQDTSEVQHRLLQYIAGSRARVTVVGDPDQTIYGFRGADPAFLLQRFATDFPDPLDLDLSTSFRFGPEIARPANQLIQQNAQRKRARCRAAKNHPGTRVTITRSDHMSASCQKEIDRLLSRGVAGKDIAVLCRVWSQIVAVDLACMEAGIQAALPPGKGAFGSSDIQACLRVLRLAREPVSLDQDDYQRLLRFPHCGLPQAQINRLAEQLVGARHPGRTLEKSLLKIQTLHGLQRFRLKQTATAWQQLAGPNSPASELLLAFLRDTALYRSIRHSSATADLAQERCNHIQALCHYLAEQKLSTAMACAHLDELASRSAGRPRTGAADQPAEALTLASIHQTKGLEWSHVILLGASRHYMPWADPQKRVRPGMGDAEHLQAERRLMYVAMTRAKYSLTVIAPASTEMDSPFLSETGLVSGQARKLAATS